MLRRFLAMRRDSADTLNCALKRYFDSSSRRAIQFGRPSRHFTPAEMDSLMVISVRRAVRGGLPLERLLRQSSE
jgi:hypothetical protein